MTGFLDKKTRLDGLRLIIFIVVTSLSTAVLVVLIGNITFGATRTYKAEFSDATGLVKGDDIRIAGVKVGSVKDVEVYERSKAMVTFKVLKTATVTKSSTATIRYRNLVGQRYISVTQGVGDTAMLPEKAMIPLSRTQPALDLSLLFNGFKPLFAALSPADINKLSYEIVQVFQGEGGNVESLLVNTSSVTQALASRDKVIGSLITNLNDVLSTVSARDDQLTSLIVRLREFVGGLNDDRQAILGSLDSISNLTDQTADLATGIRPPLAADVKNLKKVATNLNANTGEIDRALQVLPIQAQQDRGYGDVRLVLQLLPVQPARQPRAADRHEHPAQGQRRRPGEVQPVMSVPFRERNPVTIGAISMAVIALLMLSAFKADRLPLIGGGETYYANFKEAGGIKADDEVRVAGVRVGKVRSVELSGDHVRVQMTIDKGVELGTTTGAQIKVKTLLGAMFMALVPKGAGELRTGSTIPISRTTSAYDVVDAFSGLAERADAIDVDQLRDSLNTLASVTANTPEAFRGTLKGLSDLSQTIASRDTQLQALLKNTRSVSSVLADRDQDIVTLMQNSDTLLRALVQRRDSVHRLLVSTSTLSQQLTGLVNDTKADLKPALAQLQTVADTLLRNQTNLDETLRLMAPFYRVFTNTLGNGPWFDNWIQNLPPIPTGG